MLSPTMLLNISVKIIMESNLTDVRAELADGGGAAARGLGGRFEVSAILGRTLAASKHN